MGPKLGPPSSSLTPPPPLPPPLTSVGVSSAPSQTSPGSGGSGGGGAGGPTSLEMLLVERAKAIQQAQVNPALKAFADMQGKLLYRPSVDGKP